MYTTSNLFLGFLLVLFSLSSCSLKVNKASLFKIKSDYISYNAGFYLGDKIFTVDNDTNFTIINYKKSKDQILKYDYNAKQLDSSIIHFVEFYDAIYIHNLDSIFLIHKRAGKLYLVNQRMELVNKWQIPNIIDSIKYNIMIEEPIHVIFHNNIFIFKVTPATTIEEYYSKFFELEYDLKNSKILNLFLKFPKTYSKDHWWHGYGNLYSKCLNELGDIVYSFPAYNNLFKFSELENKVIEISVSQSMYFKDFPPPTFPNDRNQITNKTVIEYKLDKEFYHAIYYDKYRNIYYRIAEHSQPLIDSSGNKNTDYTRPWSIMVFDEDFNLLGEEYFEPNKYYYWFSFLIKDGLLVMRQTEEGLISYDLFEFNGDN